MEFIVYRYCATGVFGYIEYDQVNQFCNISGIVAPNAPVYIRGRGYSYVSSFDVDTTLVPGVTARWILEESGNQTAGVLRWDGKGKYTLIFGCKQYNIRCDGQQYVLMSEKGENLLNLSRISRDMVIPANVQAEFGGYDITPMFEVCIYASLPDALISIVSALPMLEFGL